MVAESSTPSQLLAALSLPPVDCAKLSFCNSNKLSAVREWVDSLQATKVMHTSAALYQAAGEFAHLKTDFGTRINMLEAVRPQIHYATVGLQKHYLNQSVILDDSGKKSLLIAQALQKYLADGYTRAIVDIETQGKANDKTFEQLALSIQRSISAIGTIFFRNHQSYAQTAPNLWKHLHTLYRVARFYSLLRQPVRDDTLRAAKAESIESAYSRILMLATARTNQMTQAEIESCQTTFENWQQGVKLTSGQSDDARNFLVQDLEASNGPLYKTQVTETSQDSVLEIDFQMLIGVLAKQSAPTEDTKTLGQGIQIPREFSKTLLSHLIDTWSSVSQRRHERRASAASMDVCVGISDAHYYVCAGQEFDVFLESAAASEGQGISRFSQGLTPAAHLDEPATHDVQQYRVALQNSSAGGFCLLWDATMPARLSAGELIGLREPGQRTWQLGVVRWMRQLKQASQLGIQVVSSSPKPYALALNYESGGYSEYMRGFLLPPSRLGASHPSLLVASAPFQEHSKVRIVDGEREWKAHLEQLVFSTKSIRQFRFRNIEIAEPSTDPARTSPRSQARTPSNSGEDFDSTWD